MSILELLLIAVGLSMDAFAVSICRGVTLSGVTLRKSAVVGAWFGLFQAGMPLVGYFVGRWFAAYIMAYDHWIAFGLLVLIGGNMIRGVLWPGEEEAECGEKVHRGRSLPLREEPDLKVKVMLPLSVATSIDALAVGVSFAFLQIQIAPAVTLIGLVTFALSVVGVTIGTMVGSRFKERAEICGGIILILIGVKILLEHTGIL
ncbi:MAG: manganese efflux pump [Firmicutes bacterium]|nr:manganese efflux pump [Bacillota bacterium]